MEPVNNASGMLTAEQLCHDRSITSSRTALILLNIHAQSYVDTLLGICSAYDMQVVKKEKKKHCVLFVLCPYVAEARSGRPEAAGSLMSMYALSP